MHSLPTVKPEHCLHTVRKMFAYRLAFVNGTKVTTIKPHPNRVAIPSHPIIIFFYLHTRYRISQTPIPPVNLHHHLGRKFRRNIFSKSKVCRACHSVVPATRSLRTCQCCCSEYRWLKLRPSTSPRRAADCLSVCQHDALKLPV